MPTNNQETLDFENKLKQFGDPLSDIKNVEQEIKPELKKQDSLVALQKEEESYWKTKHEVRKSLG